MDSKPAESPLKSILNSPARFTPAVPTPDWSLPTTSATASTAVATNGINPSTAPAQNALHTNGNDASQMIVSTPGDHISVTLQNCVTTVDLKTKLDLKLINGRTRNSEYNPARFHGVVMRIREPRATALIFSSGKVVCTGARNESAALLATKKFARIIQRIIPNVRFTNFKVQNVVATCDLRFPIKLESLNQMHGQFSSYEPELFPGLIYRMVKPRLVLMIFVNGKVVFTGAKTRQDISEALDNIYPILKSFRKN